MSVQPVPLQAYAPTVDIQTAAFLVEQAAHQATTTQDEVQAQLASAAVWLGYAVDYYNRGAVDDPGHQEKYEALADSADAVRLAVMGVQANVPPTGDPAFALYKTGTVPKLHGLLGRLAFEGARFAKKQACRA